MKECPKCQRCFADHVNHCPNDGDVLKFTIHGDIHLDGRYQLESRLGQGGMGAVYKARHIFLKTLHAIKIILPDLVGNDPSLLTRFRQEAMAAAAIRHPNIIAVTDFGVVNGTTPFLVMEFIQGQSLHDLLVEHQRLSPEEALEVMTGIGAGLSAAHRRDIVHRDLKPLNIMLKDDALTRSESIKLLDFGLAKIKSGELLGSFVAAQTTGLMGSPFYMAPEQWSEEEPDRRADIYSLGVILYQMLAGAVPFKGSNIPSIMKKHLTSAPPSFSIQGVEVPSAIEAVVRRALEKEPDDRPQTVEEFIAELRAAVHASPAPTTYPNLPASLIGLPTMSITPPTSTIPPPPTTDDSRGQPGATTGRDNHRHAGTFNPEAASGGATSANLEALAPPAEAPHVPPHQTPGDVRATNLGLTPSPTSVPPSSDALVNAEPDASFPRGNETGFQLANETAYQAGFEQTSHLAAAPDHLREKDSRLAEAARPKAEAAARWPQQKESVEPRPREMEKPAHAATSEEHAYARSGAQDEVAPATPVGGAPSAGPRDVSWRAVVPVPALNEQKKSRTPLIALAGIVLVLLGGGLGSALYWLNRPSVTPASVNPSTTNLNANRATNATVPDVKTTVEMISFPGGAFQMGRPDVPPRDTNQHSLAHLQWVYTQWPAHAVQIEPFAIDKTEVTNAEYAEFVKATAYPPPPDWDGLRPAAGQEMWPVRNVTFEDAQRFAQWRSKRDGVEYRLPTEEEWEYAARGGDASRLYPWGNEWQEGAANLDSDRLKPVGAHAPGQTPQGVQDMIGNVWEWTSTPAAMYKGNKLLRLLAEDENKVVVRGGSYQSSARGDKLITATARTWEPKDKRDPVIGFRLVRAKS